MCFRQPCVTSGGDSDYRGGAGALAQPRSTFDRSGMVGARCGPVLVRGGQAPTDSSIKLQCDAETEVCSPTTGTCFDQCGGGSAARRCDACVCMVAQLVRAVMVERSIPDSDTRSVDRKPASETSNDGCLSGLPPSPIPIDFYDTDQAVGLGGRQATSPSNASGVVSNS